MTSATPSSPLNPPSPADVADRVRSLQLGQTERKTAEFGIRGYLWLIVISLIAAVGWWFFQQGGAVTANWRQWIPGSSAKLEVVPVKVEGGEEVLLDVTGYITPKTKVTISTRVPGVIAEMNAAEGQKVEKGQVLAKLDDSMFVADLAQAQAAQAAAEYRLAEMKNGALPEEIDQARTAVELAQNKLTLVQRESERLEKLRKDISESEWDTMVSTVSDAKANLKTLEQKLKLLESGPRAERMKMVEAEVSQAKALVSKAEVNLNHATLTSPITGVVLERKGEVGENLRPEAIASGLYVVADLSQLEVQVDVEEQSLGKLQIGQPCRVMPDAYADKSYEAKIARWQPQVNRARAVVRVILTITNPDEYLLAEMNCRAVILASVEKKPETLWVPANAVVKDDSQSNIFVVSDGVAKQRTVQLGATRDNLVEVISGLAKNDRVVVSAGRPPAEGQKVQ